MVKKRRGVIKKSSRKSVSSRKKVVSSQKGLLKAMSVTDKNRCCGPLKWFMTALLVIGVLLLIIDLLTLRIPILSVILIVVSLGYLVWKKA